MRKKVGSRSVTVIGWPDAAAGMTADQMNEVLKPHGMQLPATPTPAQLALARVIIGFYADMDHQRDEAAVGEAERERLTHDPERKAAYEAARAACYFDTEARFPGWVPQPLTAGQQADKDLCERLRETSGPSRANGDPTRAALMDEANRLASLSHGRSREARAIRAEMKRLAALASRLGREDSRRRRRETSGSWKRLDPWPTTCHVCGQPIDPALAWPDPLSGSLGHEPPIRWASRHPEYDGPRVLRPEHLACNVAKGANRDEDDAGGAG